MKYVEEVCKLGPGAACCKYLAIGEQGFRCLKLTDLRATIDARSSMVAKGDNCEGVSSAVDLEKREPRGGEPPMFQIADRLRQAVEEAGFSERSFVTMMRELSSGSSKAAGGKVREEWMLALMVSRSSR